MKLVLDALTAGDCERVRQWRNRHREGLRTSYPLTPFAQETFYREVASRGDGPHRYFAVRRDEIVGFVGDVAFTGEALVGMGGLTNVSRENGTGEISLIIDPAAQRKGVGRAAADLLLMEAFGTLRLETVWGEVYDCNPAVPFWRRLVQERNGHWVTLPGMKLWNGQRYASHFFCIERSR